MKNTQKIAIRSLATFIFLFLLVSCKKTSYYKIETCIINYSDLKLKHIHVLFSSEKYNIKFLFPNKKKCLLMPVYADTSYNITLCMKNNKYEIKNIGYYWSESNISNVNIFLENKTVIKNEPYDNGANMEYSYTYVGKCNDIVSKK